MQISGLQKLTLIDYPKKLACTIFLQGCNFRCGFCHNPELVLPGRIAEKYSAEQVLEFLQSRKQYLEAVCITGGEPLLDPELLTFIEASKPLAIWLSLIQMAAILGYCKKPWKKILLITLQWTSSHAKMIMTC